MVRAEAGHALSSADSVGVWGGLCPKTTTKAIICLTSGFDPFMGGGTTMMEANRVGCSVMGTDINPMAWWIVRQELLDLDVEAYLKSAAQLRAHLEAEIGHLYRTSCGRCGKHDARVKYFLWVKTAHCGSCGRSIDLFPNFLLSEDVRHPANVFVCGHCGELFETETGNNRPLSALPSGIAVGEYRRTKRSASIAIALVAYPNGAVPKHRLYAIEYHCETCGAQSNGRTGRLFKKVAASGLGEVRGSRRAVGEDASAVYPGRRNSRGR